MIQKVGDLLSGALRGAGLEATSLIWQIAESWADIVGPRVAKHAAPTRLSGDELTLAAPDAVWRQELTLLGPDIAAKVNNKIKGAHVARIRLVSGPARSPGEPRRGRRRLRSSTPLVPQPPPNGPKPETGSVAAALEALAHARAFRLEEDDRARRVHHARIRRHR